MKCNNCGAENVEGNQFCSACGSKLEPALNKTEETKTIKCGKCRTENPSENRFCSACGNSLIAADKAASGQGVHISEPNKGTVKQPSIVKEPIKPKRGIEVDNSFPMENKVKRFYIIPVLVCVFLAVAGIVKGDIIGGIIASIFVGAFVFAVIDMTVCRAKIVEMTRTEYCFPSRIYDLDIIYAAIKNEFMNKGFSVKRDKALDDSIDFFKDSYRYVLRLNKENGTFTIGIYKTLEGQLSLKGSRLFFRLYGKSLINVPLIVYTFQEKVRKLDLADDSELKSFAQVADSMKGEFSTSLAKEVKGAAFQFVKYAVIVVAILGIGIVAAKCCNNDKYINMVQTGFPVAYPDKSYGKAFNDFFSNPEWKYFKSDDNRKVVEFTGGMTYRDQHVNATIQFTVDDRDENNIKINLVYLGFDDVPQNNLTKMNVMSAVFENDAKSEISTEEIIGTSDEQDYVYEQDIEDKDIYEEYMLDFAKIYFYDIDKDGTNELIKFIYDDSVADSIYEVYTYKDGKVKYCGNMHGSWAELCTYNENGILVYRAAQGMEIVYKYSLNDDELYEEKILYKEDLESYDDISDLVSGSVELQPEMVADELYENVPTDAFQDYQSESSEYIIYDSDSRYITEADLQGLSKEQLRIARNEIYARYGRKFSDAELQSYFDSCSWYNGYIEPNDFNIELNQYEKANLTLIKEVEDSK